jgi:peptidoglycan/LPS O-acetylase OafA/YrhL
MNVQQRESEDFVLKMFKRFEPLIWACTTGAMICAWAYTSFATQKYVDAKHESVFSTLERIEKTVERVDQRTYELAKEKR